MDLLNKRNKDSDTVEYWLFPNQELNSSETDIRKYIEEQLDAYLVFLSKYCVSYIWQNESFQLRSRTGTIQSSCTGSTAQSAAFANRTPQPGSLPPHLYGRTSFGDYVEDEWFIVFLLSELSKAFPGLVIRMVDSDGEFLLIEAADYLPKWLTPDTAENRVYLYNGRVHIIPSVANDDRIRDTPVLSVAVPYVREHPLVTEATSRIQQQISQRIRGYPDKTKENLHRTHCYLPAGLGAVLDSCPQLIAPIVQAFYERDALDLKSCITFKHFQPGTRVTREVLFTRCLYAQLTQQRFQPDRRSGFTLPSANSLKFKAADLGMKLAHGAEILCSKCTSSSGQARDLDRLKRDSRWHRFVTSLTERGYFKNEMEGSRLYRKLLDDAKKYYLTSTSESMSDLEIGCKLLSVLKSCSYDIEEMKQQEKNLRPPDDDSWLELAPQDLDRILRQASGRRDEGDVELQTLADNMKKFVGKISSHEGAEFPGADEDSDSDTDVHFDPNSVMQNMQKMFDFGESDDGSSSGMDEYESDDDMDEMFSGKKPSKSSKTPSKKSADTSMKTVRSGSVPLVKTQPQKSAVTSNISCGSVDYLRGPAGDTQAKGQKPTNPLPTRGPAGDTQRMGGKLSDPNTRSSQTSGKENVGDYLGMKDYMEAMDRELAKTAVGQSFVREGDEQQFLPKAPPRRKRQLQKEKAARVPTKAEPEDCDIDELDDDFRPVNVDLNTVQNMLESFSAHNGTAGPTSNILGSMGYNLPPDYKK